MSVPSEWNEMEIAGEDFKVAQYLHFEDPHATTSDDVSSAFLEYRKKVKEAKKWFEDSSIQSSLLYENMDIGTMHGKNPFIGFDFPFLTKSMFKENPSRKIDPFTLSKIYCEFAAMIGNSSTPQEISKKIQILDDFGMLKRPLKETAADVIQTFGIQPAHFTFVDIETTSVHPASGDVIDFGAYLVDERKGTIEECSYLYDMENKDFQEIVGVPNEEIHHISLEEISGKPLFKDPESQKEIGKILYNENTIFSAHNMRFEGLYLSVSYPRFWSIFDRANPEVSKDLSLGGPSLTLDTRFHAHFLSDCVNGNLENFSTYYGADYGGAHRGLYDAKLAANAFFAMREELKNL